MDAVRVSRNFRTFEGHSRLRGPRPECGNRETGKPHPFKLALGISISVQTGGTPNMPGWPFGFP